ncbi:MAG: hypothetical protein WC812_04710 [Candidatus Pacearchaeota archaeon]|jgi:hypothetical protein
MKKLSDRTKKIIGNASLAVPFGFVAYNKLNEKLSKQNKDSRKINNTKTSLNSIWSGIFGIYIAAFGFQLDIWTPKQFKEFRKKTKQTSIENSIKESHKDFLLQAIDSDKNGLSIKEQYRIHSLMGIQDSATNYFPTSNDWERAYQNYLELNPTNEQE